MLLPWADLKKIYTSVTLDEAEENLLRFSEKWRKQYPSCVKSWEDNWDILSTFFAYPTEIRKIIYTTNIIEGLNRQFRQITKNKPSFTNDDSLRRMLYLASRKIVGHWTARCRNWGVVLSQLQLMFQDRLTALTRVVSNPGNPLICSCFLDYNLSPFTQNFLTGSIKQLTLHPGPHALTAGVIMTAASVAVHALADAVLFQCGPIGPAGVLGAPVRVDDGSPQGRIGRRRTVQRPHTQLRPHVVIHGQTEDSEIKAVKDG